MHLLGNYKHWFKQEWLDYIYNNVGDKKPQWIGGQAEFNQYIIMMKEAKYDMNATYWFKFSEDNWPFSEEPYPLTVEGVEFITGENCEWWILKYMPGNMMPFHVDMDGSISHMTKLYMTLEDYKQGHVMIYGDRLISNYKAGDLFMFKDILTPHGACNMGYEPRYILCITMYNELGKAFREQYKDLIDNAVYR